MYNLKLFGKHLKTIRENLNLTQEEVSNISYLSRKTIIRIEMGEHSASFDTLDLLSPIYKIDVPKLLLEYRLNDFESLQNIISEINIIIFDSQYGKLDKYLSEIELLNNNCKNLYYNYKFEQLYYFIMALTSLDKVDKVETIILLERSMQVFHNNFSAKNYKDSGNNSFEILILMDLAISFYKIGDLNLYEDIMRYCFEISSPNWKIYPKICVNLGNLYTLKKDYKTALYYFILGVQSAQKYNNILELDLLFYGMGFSKMKLKIDDYKIDFQSSINFCDMTGRNNTKRIIEDKIAFYDRG